MPRRDELLTNCKEATKISPTPWCFTADYNKRRACTAEAGATRPLSWFLAAKMVRALWPIDRQYTPALPSLPCTIPVHLFCAVSPETHAQSMRSYVQ